MLPRIVAAFCFWAAASSALAQTGPDYVKIGDAVISIGDALGVIGGEIKKMGGPVQPPPPPPSSPLPILTDARVAALKAMRDSNSAAWQQLLKEANASKVSVGNNDSGFCATIVWKVTGDTTYRDAAWACLLRYTAIPPNTPYDGISDGIVEGAVGYACLKGSGTTAQESQAVANLTLWGQVGLGTAGAISGTQGIPPSNANYCGPYYFGLALYDAIGIPCPLGGNWLDQTATFSGFSIPVGGLKSTAANRTTARNAVRQYVEVLSKGGTWCEGPYDCKSVPRYLLAWAALRDLLGTDYFPEIATWVPAACDAVLLDYSADFKSTYQWGDRTRLELDYARRLSIYSSLQGSAIRLGDQTRTGQASYLVSEILAVLGIDHVDPHFWYFYDDAAAIAKRPADPISNYSPGVGMYRRADGNNSFAAFFPDNLSLNHQQCSLDLYWCVAGTEVLTRPFGYSLQLSGIDIPGQPTGNRYGTNNLVACGLTQMNDSGSLDAVTTADYSYFVGQTSGTVYGPGTSKPQTVWLHEMTRTVFFLPSQDCLMICDRINLDDPRKLDLTQYGLPARNAILAAMRLVEQVWHCPVQPTSSVVQNKATVAWSVGSDKLELSSFSPTGDLAVDVVDESVLWSGVNSIGNDQKKWQFRVCPAADNHWNSIITCIRLNPDAQVPTTVTSGAAAGWRVGDTVVVFGVDQSDRLLDPATIAIQNPTTASTVYAVGCSGANVVTVMGR